MYVGMVKTAAPAAPQGLMRSVGDGVGRWWGNITGRTVGDAERAVQDWTRRLNELDGSLAATAEGAAAAERRMRSTAIAKPGVIEGLGNGPSASREHVRKFLAARQRGYDAAAEKGSHLSGADAARLRDRVEGHRGDVANSSWRNIANRMHSDAHGQTGYVMPDARTLRSQYVADAMIADSHRAVRGMRDEAARGLGEAEKAVGTARRNVALMRLGTGAAATAAVGVPWALSGNGRG